MIPSSGKGTARKSSSSGWAAFDLQQRRKLGLLVEPPHLQTDPFPSILKPSVNYSPVLNNSSSSSSSINNHSHKPFSSLLSPPPVTSSSSSSTENGTTCHDSNQIGDSSSSSITGDNNRNEQDCRILSLRKLKEIHKWAGESLLEDVLSAVGNDVEEALTLLNGMAPHSALLENTKSKLQNTAAPKDVTHDNELEAKADASLGNTYDLCVLETALQNCLHGGNKKLVSEPASCVNMFPDNSMEVKMILGQLRNIPVEPEWEEDDIYLSHRKDALKMMRSAAQQSKAATSAFYRGDHSTARRFSLKAQEEWSAAETLNAKAAKEILNVRNSNNDFWKLDLHGLHATEAIQALMERLSKIETQVQENNSDRSNRISCINLCESSGPLTVDKLTKHQAATKHRSSTLQVITGVGNHSRGEASLPTAVKNYLSENGYRFDEARPGVITVRPKLRLR